MIKIREACEKLPFLYKYEENDPKDVPCIKLFNPTGIGTWYLTEYGKEDDVCFGLCMIFEPELGYVSIKELEDLKCPPLGLGIEQDEHWKGTLLDAMRAEGYKYISD